MVAPRVLMAISDGMVLPCLSSTKTQNRLDIG
jgi:hypothetical protein